MRPTSQILEQLDHEVDLVLAQLVLDVDEPTVQHQVLRQLGQTLDEPVDRVLVLISQFKKSYIKVISDMISSKIVERPLVMCLLDQSTGNSSVT